MTTEQAPQRGGPTPPRRRHRASVAGVAGGVGATTIATAIGATDWGVFTGHRVDVLVCRATGDSLIRAARAAQLVIADGHPQPVIAVTAADASGPSRPVTARLRLLEPHAQAVLVLPYVRRWQDLSTPLDEARGLLNRTATDTPRPLRHYAAALRELRAAVDARSPIGAPHPPAHHAGRRHRERTQPACTP